MKLVSHISVFDSGCLILDARIPNSVFSVSLVRDAIHLLRPEQGLSKSLEEALANDSWCKYNPA